MKNLLRWKHLIIFLHIEELQAIFFYFWIPSAFNPKLEQASSIPARKIKHVIKCFPHFQFNSWRKINCTIMTRIVGKMFSSRKTDFHHVQSLWFCLDNSYCSVYFLAAFNSQMVGKGWKIRRFFYFESNINHNFSFFGFNSQMKKLNQKFNRI